MRLLVTCDHCKQLRDHNDGAPKTDSQLGKQYKKLSDRRQAGQRVVLDKDGTIPAPCDCETIGLTISVLSSENLTLGRP